MLSILPTEPRPRSRRRIVSNTLPYGFEDASRWQGKKTTKRVEAATPSASPEGSEELWFCLDELLIAEGLMQPEA